MDERKRDVEALNILMDKVRHELDSFWSFEKIREEYRAAGVAFTYRDEDTPEGYYIREFPDGSKTLVNI